MAEEGTAKETENEKKIVHTYPLVKVSITIISDYYYIYYCIKVIASKRSHSKRRLLQMFDQYLNITPFQLFNHISIITALGHD